MRIQLSSISGLAKLTKIKDDTRSVETPTMLNLNSSNTHSFWEIGDSNVKYTMNCPFSLINQQLKELDENNTDFKIIHNFLMQYPLNEEIIENHLIQTKKKFSKIKEFNDSQVVIIQPNESAKSLKKVLKFIVDFNIQNIAITNLIPILNNHRKLLDFLITLKTELPIDRTIILLSPVSHIYLPILTYLGIDIFTNEFAKIAAKEGIYLTDTTGYYIQELKEKICFCEICSKKEDITQLKEFLKENNSALEEHNLRIFLKKILEIRSELKNNSLRGYLESQIQNNVTSASMLRSLDKNWNDLIISRTATWSSTKIKSITSYGYSRPEIIEFQNRISNRFEIPSEKEVIVIFPCSARKPYSHSKSHKKFLEVLDSIDHKKRGYIQEIILTSPLGVIPRQLERVYPAAHYDIPVTGDWDSEEKNIAINLLEKVLSKTNPNATIIAHVHDEYVELCESTETILNRKFVYTSKENRATSNQSLQKLKQKISKELENKPPIKYSPDTEQLRLLADYQYGKGVGELIFPDNYSIFGKPRMPLKITKGKTQIGTIQQETGKFTLSLTTGKLLSKLKKYYIKFDGEQLEGSTLFAVGVKEADPAIRPSDDVVIVNNNFELLAVGQAIVSGEDMKNLSRGSVAKIRQKVK